MTRKLQYQRRAPVSGNARSLVVFLHGYGADGADLLSLAAPLSRHLPDTVFIAPNAPVRATMNPAGYQWFPIPRFDGSSESQARAGVRAAADDLNAFLDETLERESISYDKTIIIGFSQGAMLALYIAPRRRHEIAGLVSFSGWLPEPEALAREALVEPPVLLLHGDADEMVPPAAMPAAAAVLRAAGFEVRTHVEKGMGHGIAPDGLSLALAFMRDRLA